jgi:hypothetical protein
MTFTHALSTNNYGPAKFIVDTNAANGTHTTIASAIAVASSGDTIAIRPGTYTEDFTLPAGVHVTGLGNIGDWSNVTIVGKVTMTAAGNGSISNLQLKTNGDYCVSITGSNAVNLNLNNVLITPHDSTAILINNANATFIANNCYGNSVSTYAYHTITSCTQARFDLCNFTAAGTPGTSTIAAGLCYYFSCVLQYPISTSSTANINISDCFINLTNTTVLTTAGTGVNNSIRNSTLISGTATAVSIGSGTLVQIFSSALSSSNTNPVDGLGTVNYSAIQNNSTGSEINATTQTAYYTQLGKYRALAQPMFSAYVNSAKTNVTGDSTAYTIIYETEVFDIGSNYDASTGIFTAPVTGKYLFCISIRYGDLETAMTKIFEYLITSNRSYYTFLGNIGARRSGANDYEYCNWRSIIADMDAGDTAYVNTTIQGSTKTVDIDTGCFFQGFLLA